jgi:hypothetical protein
MSKSEAGIFTCLLIIIGIVAPLDESIAGNESDPVGARASGMGNAAVTLSSVWANFSNQANLTELNTTTIGIHNEISFGINQLATSALAIAKPAGSGIFGFCASYFGYSGYNESKTGLSYSLKLFHGISAGIQLEYLCAHAGDNSPKSRVFTFDIGFLAKLSKTLNLGVHIFNPANIQYLNNSGESLSPIATIGLGYHALESLTLVGETEKSLGFDPIYRAGIEFGLGKSIFLRTGIKSSPWENSFGIGFKIKRLVIDVALSRNPILGYSPAFSMCYELK